MFGLGPQDWQAVALSLKVSSLATLLTLPLALATAYLLARVDFIGKTLVNTLVHLPLILPPVVTGYLLLLVFGTQAPLGKAFAGIGITFAFRWTGAALAAGIMAFPLMVRAIRLSIEAVDPKLERAALTLGAAPWQVFARITLPLVTPGVLTAAVIGFAKAFGEFGATITFVSNIAGETRTLPTAIYTALQIPGGEAAVLRLVAIAIAIAVAALVLSEWAARAVARRVSGA
ncbi:molybdate ABC transporter permease subunit [Aquimixticola soesokkakensis]|uniref:molybdate ABC transporter permease subunit n=1 Tax=Aquimixticola soesokkakensis TaxID=1519096 RepID=UPI000A271367|nr:molybdate ABC transporter permease subunit [Aquimixticola soesokkakensis]